MLEARNNSVPTIGITYCRNNGSGEKRRQVCCWCGWRNNCGIREKSARHSASEHCCPLTFTEWQASFIETESFADSEAVLSSASPIKAVDWSSRAFLEPRYLRLGIVGLVAAVRLGAGQQSLAAGSTSPCSSIKSRAKRMRASHCRQTTPRYHRLSTDRGCGIVVSTIARRLLPSLPSPTSSVAAAPRVARSHRASLIYGK